MPLTLHITWKFPPEQVSAFYDALRPLQEKLVQEAECLYFNVYEVGQDAGIVRLVEIWDCDMKWMVNVRFNFCFVQFSPFLIKILTILQVQSKKEYYQPFYEAAKK